MVHLGSVAAAPTRAQVWLPIALIAVGKGVIIAPSKRFSDPSIEGGEYGWVSLMTIG